jgi:hypothetical protein
VKQRGRNKKAKRREEKQGGETQLEIQKGGERERERVSTSLKFTESAKIKTQVRAIS